MDFSKIQALREMKTWLKCRQEDLRRPLVWLGHYNEPSAMIIGVQKGGTTALFHTLMQHKLLQGGYNKELHFFSDDRIDHLNDLSRYRAHFKLPAFTASNTVFMDATPRYSASPLYLERIRDYQPKMKLIFVIRDPAKRAYSHWSMNHRRSPQTSQHFVETLSFEQAILENFERMAQGASSSLYTNYIERGMYLTTIKSILERFPEEQLLILQNNEIKTWSDETSKRIQDFLGVPYAPLKSIVRNTNPNPSSPPAEIMTRLQAFYAPHNKALFEHLQMEPNWS